MKPFKIYEDYLKQQQKRLKKLEDLSLKEKETKAELELLQSEYQAAMLESIDGKNVDKKLNKLDGEIAEASKQHKRASEAYQVYMHVQQMDATITREDVIEAFNVSYAPAYFDEEVQPVLDELLAAKNAYLEAVRAYYRKTKVMFDFREDMSNALGYEFPYHFYLKDLTTAKEHETYFVQEYEVTEARRG